MLDASKNVNYLKTRADIYRKIRHFFEERGVLEVETPLLCSHTVTDVFIESISASGRFLQTSPEYCMKRLLAADSGPIFQICKSFRASESGSHHNPEFTMLEWYRPGFNHHDLMHELDELMQCLLGTQPAKKQSYRDCFLEHLNIDPLSGNYSISELEVLLNTKIEPNIGNEQPHFLYDFPADQAALAKIRPDDPPVAERFELYYKQLELANGFHELTDANEQLQRFEKDREKRRKLGLDTPDIDMRFIRALKSGMPKTAGVAVGLDRVVMLACNATRIQQVLTFAWDEV